MTRPWLRALRPWQWSKNGLLLLPALAAHLQWTPRLGWRMGAAIASFSMAASALYVVNDLVDRPHDRSHPEKRRRPIASGDLSPLHAGGMAVGCGLIALAFGALLPPTFLVVLGGYAFLSIAYSLVLKRKEVLDVVVLASLYTARIMAGGVAADVPLSSWFLAFSVFFFLSLALIKRVAEFEGAGLDVPAGRGYRAKDRSVLEAAGVGSAVMAALVYCLYITGDTVRDLYTRPQLLWLGLPLILYWLLRIWLQASRGEVGEDPVVFVLRDRVSWVTLAGFLGLVWIAA